MSYLAHLAKSINAEDSNGRGEGDSSRSCC
jgi:hypothetical protein